MKIKKVLTSLKTVKWLIYIFYTLNILDLVFSMVGVRTHGLEYEGNFYLRSLMKISLPLALTVKIAFPLLICYTAYQIAKETTHLRPLVIWTFIFFIFLYGMGVWVAILFLT